MGIIGNNTIGNLSYTFSGTDRQIWLPSFDYTPTVDETVSTVNMYMSSESASQGTVQVGVYRVSDGALIESAQITIPANAAEAWYEAAMPGAETLLSGVAYRVAFANPTVAVTIKHSDDQSGYGGFGATLPATFTQLGTQSRSFSMYATTAEVVTAADYTARKGSTETITHTLTADGITTATLDGETVTIGTQSGQDADIDLDETAITTSGEYDLVLGDGTDTETFTVQYNVIGLATNTLQKEGDALADLSDVRITVLNAAGTRLDRQTGLTTNGSGVTGTTIVAAGDPGDAVEVSYYSASEEAGITFVTALELL